MLSFYLIFHLNLMYSSIEEEKRPEVIEKCYWPLLDMAENYAPLGIELSGLTLEMISGIDRDWIKKFKTLIEARRVELIGSGFSQIIGPLFPKRINEKNQQLGFEIYEKILGVKPEIALVNEMAYSAGIVDVYADSGYKAIIMEWNNPYKFHKEWHKDWQFYPQIAVGVKRKLLVIWANSIAFQKFQRFAHCEMGLRDYLDYLCSNDNDNEERFFPLYANDAEIFNFRPNRYKTEAIVKADEFKRIKRLLKILSKFENFRFILPSKLLKHVENNELVLQSVEQPIPVKKQEKYNINRWALTGRDDFGINTKIFRVYKSFLSKSPSKEDYKKLLYFASSDFRTHITENRWHKFEGELNGFVGKWSGNFKEEEKFKECDFKLKQNRYELLVETDKLRVVFNKKKGLTAKEVIFKDKGYSPLIGTLPHGFYDDISLGADFYSFHSIIERPGKPKITNLTEANFRIEKQPDRLTLCDSQELSDVVFNKHCEVFYDKIKIKLNIQLPKRYLAIIHPFILTFMPFSFERESLFFATHNGGDLEKFYLKDSPVNHFQNLSALISAKHGLGATEGILIVGDKHKSVTIKHDPSVGAVVPAIFYQPLDKGFFLRVQYSAQEIDDTFVENERPYRIDCSFEISVG